MISDEAGCLPVFFFGLCFFQGRGMYRATWFVQYFNLSIANIGTIILAGQALKVCSMAQHKNCFNLPSLENFSRLMMQDIMYVQHNNCFNLPSLENLSRLMMQDIIASELFLVWSIIKFQFTCEEIS
jgi:hypothetical protein